MKVIKLAILPVIIGLICAVGFLAVRGCSSSGLRKKRLTLFISATQKALEAHRERVAEFEDLHPDVDVMIINGAGRAEGGMQKLQTMIAGDTAPDVAYVHGSNFPVYAQKGLLANLEELNAADPEPLDMSVYFPRVLDLCRVKEDLRSLPMGTVTFVLFYNKSIFEEAEVPLPTDDWTWDDFLSRAKALTQDLDNDGRTDRFGLALQFDPNITLPWIRQAGGELMNEDNTRCTLDSPEAIEALKFLLALKNQHHVAPDASEAAGQGLGMMFLTGQIGMIIGSSGAMANIQQQASRFDWDVAPLPQYRQKVTRLGTANWVVMQSSENKELAWELLKFMCNTEGQRRMMRRTGLMPSVHSLARGEEFVELFPRRNVRAVVDAVEYGRPGCRFRFWNEVSRAIKPAYDMMWISKKPDVKKLITDAVKKANRNIAESQARMD